MDQLRELLVTAEHTSINDPRDLVTRYKDGTRALFEVKTATDLYAAYQAIGQLQYRHTGEEHQYAVLPEELGRRVAGRFKKLGLETVTYTWQGQKVLFSGLPL